MIMAISTPAMAAALTNSWVQDGNTYLGTFRVKGLDDPYTGDISYTVTEYWQYLMGAASLLIWEAPNGDVYIVGSQSGEMSFSVTHDAGEMMIHIRSGVTGMIWRPSGDGYDYLTQFASGGTPLLLKHIITMRGMILPAPGVSSDVLFAAHEGDLYIVDDLGDDPPKEDSGILDWLSKFWDNLVHIVVPRDGYFSDWWSEIKAAADKKFKPIADTITSLEDTIGSLKDDAGDTGLVITLPANHFFAGQPRASVDVLQIMRPVVQSLRLWLTMVCVVMTIVACYKRLVVLFEQ